MFFFFNDTATTEIYTLSLHDALPILPSSGHRDDPPFAHPSWATGSHHGWTDFRGSGRLLLSSRRHQGASSSRSEEHTSELQSRQYLVCRLLLEKKKKQLHQSSTTTSH